MASLGTKTTMSGNHGFLMRKPNAWQLSPAYDLPPTPHMEAHRLSVNGKWSGIEMVDLQALGRAFPVRGGDEILEQVRDSAFESQ